MMRTFSRWMPSPRGPSALGILLLVSLSVGAVALVIGYPWLLFGVVGLLAVSNHLDRKRRARLRHMVAQRSGEGLCTFVRAVPRDQRDGWVLRAVYEELQPYYKVDRNSVPPRPSDRLRADLEIDPEDIEDIALTAARRARRESRNWQANPFRDRVQTVADLVSLICAQPRVAA